MKKLLLILSAVFVNLTGYAGLNPYAYNLSSDWDETKQILTVNFKLNAHPNLDVTANGNGTGIQIFAVDRDNNNKMYYIHGVPRDTIKKKIDSGDLDYSVKIPINGRSIEPNECLPKGKKLTFAVRVQGVNSKNKPNPGSPVYIEQNRPYSPHGVAVNNCQDSQDFGAVYVTECTNGISGNATWGWLNGKGQSLLAYNPRLEYTTYYRKSSNFSERNLKWNGKTSSGGNLLEPHRVVISDDGRIFVSSNNKQDKNGNPVVWEFNPQKKEYTTIVTHNSSYGDRVVAIDVKGSGNDIKMLVCYLKTPSSGSHGYYIYEYAIKGTTATIENNGNYKCRYVPESYQSTLKNCSLYNYYHYTDGLFDVAYGAEDPTTVYMGLDFFIDIAGNPANRTSLIYFNAALGANLMYNYHNCDGYVEGQMWGGAGLVTYLDHNGNERIANGRTMKANNTESDGCIQIYSLNASNVPSTKVYDPITTNTKCIINDIAIDCAYNLYAVSFADQTSPYSSGTGRLLAVAMPYSGTVTTYCPTSNTDDKEYFQLPAVVELKQDLSTDELKQLNKNHPNDCGCDIDVNLVRPLRGGMYNTICLPFNLDVKELDSNHPYYNATVLAFAGATISTINDESVLELNFESTNGVINHSKPYLIRPQNDIPSDVRVRFDNITLQPVSDFGADQYKETKNSVTYLGVMGKVDLDLNDPNEIVLILVNDNRLAQLSSGGEMLGFRGLFYFDKSVIPEGTVVRLAERKDTPTSLIDAQVKTIDIQKFLREGRVYIRVGESLYNMDGVKVE